MIEARSLCFLDTSRLHDSVEVRSSPGRVTSPCDEHIPRSIEPIMHWRTFREITFFLRDDLDKIYRIYQTSEAQPVNSEGTQPSSLALSFLPLFSFSLFLFIFPYLSLSLPLSLYFPLYITRLAYYSVLTHVPKSLARIRTRNSLAVAL